MKYFLPLFYILVCSSTYAQLLNGGMETYSITATDTIPENWMTETGWSSIPGRTTDAHSGNYAFIVNTWYHYSTGVLLNGKVLPQDFYSGWIKAGTPINYKPQSLVGFYKYTNVVPGDSAIAKVILKKWNIVKGRADTICFGIKKLPPVSAYTGFTVNLNDLMPSIQPDSIVVCFHSFDGLAGQLPCVDAYCRYLYIDDLSIQGVTGLNEFSKNPGVSFYIKENIVFLNNKEGLNFEAEVISVEGKKLSTLRSTEEESIIDLSSLPTGVYFLNLASKRGVSNSKFVIGK